MKLTKKDQYNYINIFKVCCVGYCKVDNESFESKSKSVVNEYIKTMKNKSFIRNINLFQRAIYYDINGKKYNKWVLIKVIDKDYYHKNKVFDL